MYLAMKEEKETFSVYVADKRTGTLVKVKYPLPRPCLKGCDCKASTDTRGEDPETATQNKKCSGGLSI